MIQLLPLIYFKYWGFITRSLIGWVPEITVEEMVAYDLDIAKRHALLKQHGYDVAVSKE